MARTFINWLRTLGAPEDPVATDVSSPWSAMSLLKAIYQQLADGGLASTAIAALSSTSESSVTVGTGSKIFVTQEGKGWAQGQRLRAASGSNILEGEVSAYVADSLTISIDYTEGSGTHTDWSISVAGARGTQGMQGNPGEPGPAGPTGVNGTPNAGRLARWFNSTTVEDAGVTVSTDGTLASNSDSIVPTQRAVKTYADGLIAANGALITTDIGVTVQSYSAKTAAIAALTWAADRIVYFTDTTTAAIATLTAQARTFLALGSPGADRVLIWDQSASAYVAATLNGGLEISGTTVRAIETHGIALSDETTPLATGVNKATMSLPYAFTVTGVYATLNTVSSSGVVTVDINEAGTTILSTKLTVDASEKTSGTAATAAVISDASIAANAEIGFDIDTAGTGAKGLKVFITGYRT